MGISIKLYRIRKAEDISEIENLEKERANALDSVVNLYKMSVDLAMIFLNKLDPFTDESEIGYKILYGSYNNENAGDIVCNGFIPASEVPLIFNWIDKNELRSPQGFAKMYDGLSSEVKEEMINIGVVYSTYQEDLYNGYVKPLVDFFDIAEKEKNAIIICGE